MYPNSSKQYGKHLVEDLNSRSSSKKWPFNLLEAERRQDTISQNLPIHLQCGTENMPKSEEGGSDSVAPWV